MQQLWEVPLEEFGIHEITPANNLMLYSRRFTTTFAARRNRKMFREWKEEGLIPLIGSEMSWVANPPSPFFNDHSEWQKLNFFELVWTRLVNELRTCNYPKVKILEFASTIFKVHPEMAILEKEYKTPEMKKKLRQSYLEKCMTLNIRPDDQSFNRIYTDSSKALHKTTVFEVIIQATLFKREPLLFYGTKEFGIIPFNPLEALQDQQVAFVQAALAETYVTISFLSLIDDFIFAEENPFKQEVDFLTIKEKRIIDLLRRKHLKEVVLSYDDKRETIYRASLTTSEVVNVKTSGKVILDAMRSKQYKRINITEINNNNYYIEKEELIKL